ncbi:MAG: branched-chain amino acid ABC transporter permease [Rhodospirillaceae bacterium]|jgi:branched-chain amino acid transport system permease protein|nr:branched-chain amino acid ABC transporter permease [Rhodospirillaceae bacterium]MBT3494251.1 branched-chain amino acid ABC transporter permease [Rhodospirillaceae bacterium]MBT3778669.1 branched-chain amino acid ABC transporter permease [Rhodospirillaceae bacterium]MBT3979208.1 branched-chain amino acid ABC transporter permease [Rhodospirillaceae bacterium]MBT4170739.1 branched-chain amino acid ABC transporter permease [Rhodospirillaceae bacterium]
MNSKSIRNLFTAPMLVSFLVFGTMPFWIDAIGLYQYLGLEVMIWVIFALAVNLLLGYTGLPSFGHGAFLGIGAYAFGLTQFNIAANLWVSLFGAVAATAVLGGLVAAFISHRRGIYFALMTIACAQIFFFIASKWTDVTGGEDGLLNIQRLPLDLGLAEISIKSNFNLYYLCFAAYVIIVVGMWRLVNSPFGKIITAIKQNDSRVAFLGYNVWLYKWIIFTLSCAISGLAGALFAMAQEGAYINIMSLQWSGIVILIVLIGGGFISFWGPVLGVIFYFLARDILGAYTEAWLLWFGLIFMLMVMFKPEGLAGIWQDAQLMFGRRKEAPQACPEPNHAGGD